MPDPPTGQGQLCRDCQGVSADRARRWLAAYFDDSDAAVQQALQELDDLAATDIRPPLPDISASLRLLRQQMKLASPHPVAGESPAPSPAEVSPPPADDAAGAEDARP